MCSCLSILFQMNVCCNVQNLTFNLVERRRVFLRWKRKESKQPINVPLLNVTRQVLKEINHNLTHIQIEDLHSCTLIPLYYFIYYFIRSNRAAYKCLRREKNSNTDSAPIKNVHAADSKPLLMKFQNKIFWKSRLVANSQWIFYEVYGETEKKILYPKIY